MGDFDQIAAHGGWRSFGEVGGMSYELDPNLKTPEPDSDHDDRTCGKIAEALLECVERPHKKMRRVRIRKVNLDVEFEDECLD